MRLRYRSALGFGVILLFAALLMGGCSTVSYYSQSIVGHSKLMLARKPIDSVIEGADQSLKDQLNLAKQLKVFAVSDLSLPDNKSYTSFATIESKFPVYNVVAAPEFSLDAKQWCYPIIGCASYRGYFHKQSAEAYAQSLRLRGLETTVGGASAYSTLGWFNDPILLSMMRYGDANFAETLFHELAHQRLYINGDSDFNEAFATVVGEEGTIRWLTKTRPSAVPLYRTQLIAAADFGALLERTKSRLSQAYASQQNLALLRKEKQTILSEMKQGYSALKKERWLNVGWFDTWFDRPLNNARLAAVSTYRHRVPTLRKLLASCGGDLNRFYSTLTALKPKSKISRDADGKVFIPLDCRAASE